MANGQIGGVIRHFRRTMLVPEGDCTSDRTILECFIRERDEAAFAAIVRRHGPMVLGVCRRVLQNHHDAEDAFQATFLVLVRKASAIVPREMLGNWLHGVAYRTAMKARAAGMRRKLKERQAGTMPKPEHPEEEIWSDLQPLLDQELDRLPDKYRLPIVLCDLEGKTHTQAAKQLGWPKGTVSTRLFRGRALMAKRLARHGLTLSGGGLALVLSEKAASACLPASVLSGTVAAATSFASGKAGSSVISTKVLSLTDGVLKTMLIEKLRIATFVFLAVGLLGMTMGMSAYAMQDSGQPEPRRPDMKANAAKKGLVGKEPAVAEKQVRTYHIECLLVKVDPKGEDFGVDGKGTLVGKPNMIVSEKQEATFQSAGATLIPPSSVLSNTKEFGESGLRFQVKVQGWPGGKLRLDAVLENIRIERENKGTQVRNNSIRYIALVELGESVKLVEQEIPGQPQHWVRARVVKEESVTTRIRSAQAPAEAPTTVKEKPGQ